MADLFLGLEIGLTGARAALVDAEGRLQADACCPLAPGAAWHGGNGEHEQDPNGWWAASQDAIDRVLGVAKASGASAESIRAMAVASPSGAVALEDAAGAPVGRGLMPDDPRGSDQLGELNRAGESLVTKLGHRFHTSFGLTKLAYLFSRDPSRFDRAARIVHPADSVVARLTGRAGVTDATTAMRTGYDPLDGGWPAFIGDVLHLPLEKFPRVVRPGEAIGPAEGPGAREAGLSPATRVVAGLCDACASALAAGAFAPGAACTRLGSALVLRAGARDLPRDAKQRVYAYPHPDGFWLAEGVSRAGGAVLAREFGRDALPQFDERVGPRLPTNGLVYPHVGRGERFPFVRSEMETWWMEPLDDRTERYGAILEGSAYVERLGYDVLRAAGAAADGPVRTIGGGAQSGPWLEVRASVLGRPVETTAHASAAFGMAVLAAAQVAHDGPAAAVAAMVKVRRRVEPRPDWTAAYAERYGRFLAALKAKGINV